MTSRPEIFRNMNTIGSSGTIVGISELPMKRQGNEMIYSSYQAKSSQILYICLFVCYAAAKTSF